MKFGKTCDVQVISRAVHLNSAIEVHLNSAIEVQFFVQQRCNSLYNRGAILLHCTKCKGVDQSSVHYSVSEGCTNSNDKVNTEQQHIQWLPHCGRRSSKAKQGNGEATFCGRGEVSSRCYRSSYSSFGAYCLATPLNPLAHFTDDTARAQNSKF